MKYLIVVLLALGISCVPRNWSSSEKNEIIMACFNSDGDRTECGRDQVAKPIVWKKVPLTIWASDAYANAVIRNVNEWNDLLGFEMLVYTAELSDDVDVFVFDGAWLQDNIWYSDIHAFTTFKYREGRLHSSIVMIRPEHGTLMHEIGHALGLNHDPNNKGSIMYPFSYGRYISATVEPRDLKVLRKKYRPVINCIETPDACS